MDPRFLEVFESLDGKLQALMAARPLKFGELPTTMPASGVYLFSEGPTHLYVGRSNRLRKRYFLHCRPGSQQNQASFAYKLAREALGLSKPSYTGGKQSRSGLAATAEFIEALSRRRHASGRWTFDLFQRPIKPGKPS